MLIFLYLCIGFVQLSPGATWIIDQLTINSGPNIRPNATVIQSGHKMMPYTHSDGNSQVFVAGDWASWWATWQVTENTYSNVATDVTSVTSQQLTHLVIWWQNHPYQGISYCMGNPTGWPVEPVTGATDDCSWPSLEIDSTSNAHISYQKNIGGVQEIFYTNNTTGSWVTEQVTDNATDDLYPWLALDSNGNPHIVFFNTTGLYYVKKASGIWSSPEVIASGADSTSHPYIVLDNKNHAQVCYSKSDGHDEEIYYASNMTGSWQETKVTDNNYDDLYPTIFVDPNGQAHIAYMAVEPSYSEIFYANNTTGAWSVEPVTNNVDSLTANVDNHSYYGRFFISDLLGRGEIYFWNNQTGKDEIYRARSHEPLYMVGIEETPPTIKPASIEVTPTLFSAATTISYSVPSAGKVSLKVYDISGSLVKTFVDRVQPQGNYRVTWDGSTNAGARTAVGVYFYQLSVGGYTTSVKGILK
jgi:hypothetical protein